MVADKTKSDINLNECQLERGDSTKISKNLNISSSDESTKCKSDDECQLNQSVDSSTKDDSEEDLKDLNTTYLCNRQMICDYSGDAKYEMINKTKRLSNSNSDDNSEICSCASVKTWKSRNVFSLSNRLDTTDCNFDISDPQQENLEDFSFKDTTVDDEGKDDFLLMRIRNYLAEFQELRGTSREEYTYSSLIRIMGQAIGHCLISIFYVLLNIAPVLEIILHIIRFMFDKMIDIKKTKEVRQILIKTGVFVAEVLSIYVCLIFIFGFIISPILHMSFGIFSKIMLYD